MTRLVQLQRGAERCVALVDEPRLRLLDGASSMYKLAHDAIDAGVALAALVHGRVSSRDVDYEAVYAGRADWRLLPPIDHPDEPARCLVSGTGLTHLGSAAKRDAMHVGGTSSDKPLTDSMRMFQSGLAHGRPPAGEIGVAPEWFYKGNGTVLRAHGEPLLRPRHAEDGGEEAEIAGLYVVAPDGTPRRVGMALGNEFSDHRFEQRNYLNLAGSKLRTCALGPELVVDPAFDAVAGTVTIERDGAAVWTRPITTGEAEMCHSLANLEHHHFKHDAHRRPGDVHVHYFGACQLSFGDGVSLADGDVMHITFDGFGRPLRNPLRVDPAPDTLVTVHALS
ncbi:MAG: hypothetical protein JO180_11350 [Gemmatirosa sp.]|nr:hypothetical protein [Gemmatirosa sp.]